MSLSSRRRHRCCLCVVVVVVVIASSLSSLSLRCCCYIAVVVVVTNCRRCRHRLHEPGVIVVVLQRLRGGHCLPLRHPTGKSVGETMQFHAPVEKTALKRRTSRLLLLLPVSQRKPKVRELALTSHRLVSLKPLKNGRGRVLGTRGWRCAWHDC